MFGHVPVKASMKKLQVQTGEKVKINVNRRMRKSSNQTENPLFLLGSTKLRDYSSSVSILF